MAEIPLGLSIAETDDGFTLYRKGGSKNVLSFPLSREETFGLKAKLDLWHQQQLQYAQSKSGSVQAVVVHPVEAASVATEALQTGVLLSLKSPSGESMTFRIPEEEARRVGKTLVELPSVQAATKDIQ